MTNKKSKEAFEEKEKHYIEWALKDIQDEIKRKAINGFFINVIIVFILISLIIGVAWYFGEQRIENLITTTRIILIILSLAVSGVSGYFSAKKKAEIEKRKDLLMVMRTKNTFETKAILLKIAEAENIDVSDIIEKK